MPFTLWFDDIIGLPAQEVLVRIQQAAKVPLEELRIFDLLRVGNRPLLWGVYFFYSLEGHCLYVGKNSARKLVERIPAHLSVYENDWMNHLVKRIKKYNEKPIGLIEASEVARTHTLLFIAVEQKEQKKRLASLEKFFRLFAKPKYNKLPIKKRYETIDLYAPLTDVIDEMLPRAK